MKEFRLPIIAAGIACVTFLSFAQQPNGLLVVTGKAAVAQSPSKVFPTSDLVIVEGEETIVRNELTKQIDKLVSNKSFSELNKLADDLRNSKAQIANGTWRLLTFYRVLSYEWTDDLTPEKWTG